MMIHNILARISLGFEQMTRKGVQQAPHKIHVIMMKIMIMEQVMIQRNVSQIAKMTASSKEQEVLLSASTADKSVETTHVYSKHKTAPRRIHMLLMSS
jgi:hypothetical protein